MQEAIVVEIKVGLGYCSSLRRFTVPQFRRTQQDVFNRQAKGCHWKWFNETSWNEYKIWKEHPRFECARMAVHNLIKKIKETGSTECCKGSGRPVKATAEKNASQLSCNQMKLDWKRKLEIFFWRKNFSFFAGIITQLISA